MKRVFISHPFASEPGLNRTKVDFICKKIMEENEDIIPISPLHMFSFIVKETSGLRSEILNICAMLIEMSKEVYVYNYGELSAGQKWEMRFTEARNHNERREIKIVEKKPPQECFLMEEV